MLLTRVTVTGADDRTDVRRMLGLQERFPFAEWGVLASTNREGTPRYPSAQWQARLAAEDPLGELRLSVHLCGSWMRDMLGGSLAYAVERPVLALRARRAQLNVGLDSGRAQPLRLAHALRAWNRPDGYVLQAVDDRAADVADQLVSRGLRVSTLHDGSGGRGVLPHQWGAPHAARQGYAGGLTPENLGDHLAEIARVAPGNVEVWVDAETGVRTDDAFDLQRVAEFFEAARPHVVRERGGLA